MHRSFAVLRMTAWVGSERVRTVRGFCGSEGSRARAPAPRDPFLRVARAWGDSARYDVVVESGGRLLRVQVKSTVCRSKSSRWSYVCAVHPNLRTRPYRRGEFDFLAAYVIPADVWYIIPSRVVVRGKMGMIVLSPFHPRHKYRRYKEAWHLLKRAVRSSRRRAK